jgi:hypothetical protein
VLFNREISIPLGKAVNALSPQSLLLSLVVSPGSHRFKRDHCSRAAEESGIVVFRGAKNNPLSDREPARNWMSEEVS